MEDSIFIVLIIILFYFTFFVLPQWQIRRAVKQVVKIFQRHYATDPKAAKTLGEFGIESQRGFSVSLFRGRDYKGYALQALLNAEIIFSTPDGKYYLKEEKASQIRLKYRLPPFT